MTWEQEHNEVIYAKYARKKHIKTALVAFGVMTIVVFMYLLLVAWAYSRNLREVVRCSDFATQSLAQAKYLSDPVTYGNLDANHDHIACNNLPK